VQRTECLRLTRISLTANIDENPSACLTALNLSECAIDTPKGDHGVDEWFKAFFQHGFGHQAPDIHASFHRCIDGVDAQQGNVSCNKGIDIGRKFGANYESAGRHRGTVAKGSQYLVQRVASNAVNGTGPQLATQNSVNSVTNVVPTNAAARAHFHQPRVLYV
jgi:hypothetical protein